ncbi:MAG: redoxin domain-containing protein, partial [Blastocatellia bacterium]
MKSIYDIPVKTIDGKATTLADYKGKVLLIVKVASQCGYTPQYEGLEKIYEQYQSKGFAVLGFPANNFGGQEPGTEAEIFTFCSTNYGVKFPMFAKLSAAGADIH